MASPVDDLKSWFSKLLDSDKEKVVEYLYGTQLERAKAAQKAGIGYFTRGLFLGPAPTAANVCDRCGRPY